MSTFEANWETGVLATAEGVLGIGCCPEVKPHSAQTVPTPSVPERPQTAKAAGEAGE